MIPPLLHTLRTASRHASSRQHPIPIVASCKLLLSTSPDYLNYETWHRDNYQHAAASNNDREMLNGQHHDGNVMKQQQQKHNQLEIPRTSVLMELSDNVGALHDVLKY